MRLRCSECGKEENFRTREQALKAFWSLSKMICPKCWFKQNVKEVQVVVPAEIEKAFGIEKFRFYWLYWTPWGDEAMLGCSNGGLYEEVTDWQAYLQLMELNPHLKDFELGNSEEEAKEVLLIDKKKRKAYIVPYHFLLCAIELLRRRKNS